jgi:peptidoglycan/xylan/chitin deacetylase (PgdA/CDA1 family)
VLELLRRYEVTVTFFVPGVVVEAHPQIMEAILKDGHEIAHHSHTHAWITTLTLDQEREEMEKGIEAIKKVAGYKPRGWRSPAAEFSSHTLGLIEEYGFDYSSNFFDDDEPYLLEINGRATDIVELPFRWVLDDAPFFHYAVTLPGRTMQPPSSLLEAWVLEFDALRAEYRMMMIGMHPQIIGQPSRLWVLDQFLAHVRKSDNVWIGRCDKITDDIRLGLKGLRA